MPIGIVVGGTVSVWLYIRAPGSMLENAGSYPRLLGFSFSEHSQYRLSGERGRPEYEQLSVKAFPTMPSGIMALHEFEVHGVSARWTLEQV